MPEEAPAPAPARLTAAQVDRWLGPLPRVQPLPEGARRPWMDPPAPSPAATEVYRRLLIAQPQTTADEIVGARIAAGQVPRPELLEDSARLHKWATRLRHRIEVRRFLRSRTLGQLDALLEGTVPELAPLRAAAAAHRHQRSTGGLLLTAAHTRGRDLPARLRRPVEPDNVIPAEQRVPDTRTRTIAGYTGRVEAHTGDLETWRVEVPRAAVEALHVELDAQIATLEALREQMEG